jgi:ribosomal protein L29
MKKLMEEFTGKDIAELTKLLAEKREELRDFRFSMKGSKIRNTKLGMQLRKDIARILFVLGGKKETEKK